MSKNFLKLFILIASSSFFFSQVLAQEIDADELFERLERIEKNISDIQKGRIDEIEKSLSSGYISRNESKLGEFETKIRTNYGFVEELNNSLSNLEEKLNLIDKDLEAKIKKIEKQLKKLSNLETKRKQTFIDSINEREVLIEKNTTTSKQINEEKFDNSKLNFTDEDIKKKYENAIKMLWANKYEKAEKELIELKEIKPKDLMPNIQYWLGEVYYAKKEFQKAVIEFGAGFSDYPDSIKGPDNLLKLGLSFSNLNQKNEACSAFYELEVKYKNSPKNVLERSIEERKKLNCPME